MKNLTTLILLLSALLVAPIAKATHVMGADISYTCDSAKAYTFRVTYYRSCKGVPFTNPTKYTRIRQANGSSVASVTLNLISITDVTPVCSKYGKPCSPKNTYGTGEGIEAHIYETKIDFNTSPYNSLLSGGSQCEIIFETSQCCRNSDITTGSANQNFYTYVKFNVCLAAVNNSPQFLTPPIGLLCCNQPVYTQVGATDFYENDSLSYKFAHPLKDWNSTIGYSGKYSYLKPFKAYDPTGKGIVNPKAFPPLGIHLDSENGDLIFTPTKCDEITVAVLEVEEWRKDTSGTYQLISTSRRDMQFVTKTCAGNNAPILDPPYSFKIKSTPCQISQGYCFTITTDDKVKIPPPPQSIPPPDSVKFDMLSLPPGVSMNIVSPKALHQSARVCLDLNQINLADYVNKPLRIIAQVNDNNCPLMGVTQRVYSVFFDTTVAEGRIFGQIQNDTNLNCQLDTGEGKHLHPRKMGMKTDKLKYFTTHPDGTFGLCTDTGLHVFKLLPSAWYEQACDTIHVYVPKDSTRYVNLHSKIKPGIAGYVYKDSDSCINSGKPIPFQQLKLTPGNHVVTTDLNGFFLFPVSPGTYTVRLINDTSSFVANCATTFQLTLNANETAYTDDFLLKPIPRSDLNVSVVYNSGSTVRKGDDCYAVIKVENIGTKAIDTTFISAILPSGLVDSAKSTAGWDSLGGGQFSRRVLHLQPKQSYHFRLYLKTSSLNTRDTIWCRVQSDSAVLLEDTDHSNNRDEKQLKVVAPYDPNIKSATPDSIFTVDNRELVYTVEFQNEGTANAIQVFILDTLPKNLDPSTFKILGSSHPFTHIIQDNILILNSNYANLPPKSVDEAGSRGHVSFSYQLYDTIFEPQFVRNKAGIYFDLEDVVITNTQINHFKSPTEFTDTTRHFYCAEDRFEIPFVAHFQPEQNNHYILEITDSSGSYATFTPIDTITTNAQTDTFSLNVPATLPSGNGYVIRIRTTAIHTVMFESSYFRNIEIQRPETSTLISSTIPICAGQTFDVSSSINYASNDFYINDTLVSSSSGSYNSDSIKHNDLVYCLHTTSEGCKTHSDSLVAEVLSIPSLNFYSDSLFCIDSVQVDFNIDLKHSRGFGKADSIHWVWGDGASEILSSDRLSNSHQYVPGSFNLRIKATNEICSDSLSLNITAGIQPTAAFDIEFDKICEADSLLIEDKSTTWKGVIDNLQFDLGDGFTSDLASFKHQFPDSGLFVIKLLTTDIYGCTDTTMKSVDVVKGPVLQIIPSKLESCLSDAEVQFGYTIRNPHEYIIWSYDGKSSTDSVVNHRFTKVGEFPVSLFAKGIGTCSDSSKVVVRIHPHEQANFNMSEELCDNESETIEPASISNDVTYRWKVSNQTSTGTSFMVDGSLPLGINEIWLFTETTNGCLDSTSHRINIIPKPTVNAEADSICFPGQVTFINKSTSYTDSTLFSINWGDNQFTQNQSFTPILTHNYNPGIYQIRLRADNGGCSDSSSVVTQTFPKPIALFEEGKLNPTNSFEYLIDNQSTHNDENYWSFDGEPAVRNDDETVAFEYGLPGDHLVHLVVRTTNGCSDTFEMSIVVTKQIEFYIPTAFSPNSDGFNDDYHIHPAQLIDRMEFLLFDRWGRKVADSKDPNSIIPNDLNSGVYVYTLKIVDIFGEHYEFKGTINVFH